MPTIDQLQDASQIAFGLLNNTIGNRDSLVNINPMERNLEADLSAGDYISGETCLFFGGPPTLLLARKNYDLLKPMGFVINASIQSQKQMLPWDEINAKNTRHVVNRVSHGVSLGRVRCNHNSFMYSLYRWLTYYLLEGKGASILTDDGTRKGYVFASPPGYYSTEGKITKNQKHYDNLGSNYFLMPTGILSLELDHYMKLVSALYFENCKVTLLGRQISENPLIIENVNITPTDIIPAIGINFTGVQQRVFSLVDQYKQVFTDMSGREPDKGIIGGVLTDLPKPDRRLPPISE